MLRDPVPVRAAVREAGRCRLRTRAACPPWKDPSKVSSGPGFDAVLRSRKSAGASCGLAVRGSGLTKRAVCPRGSRTDRTEDRTAACRSRRVREGGAASPRRCGLTGGTAAEPGPSPGVPKGRAEHRSPGFCHEQKVLQLRARRVSRRVRCPSACARAGQGVVFTGRAVRLMGLAG